MANTATARTKIPVNFAKSSIVGVTPVIVSIDTTSSDLTIYTPAADKHAAIVGMIYTDSTSHNLTIKAGSTSLVTLEMAANMGIFMKLDGSLGPCGGRGETLVLNSDAAISSMLVYIAEFGVISVGG